MIFCLSWLLVFLQSLEQTLLSGSHLLQSTVCFCVLQPLKCWYKKETRLGESWSPDCLHEPGHGSSEAPCCGGNCRPWSSGLRHSEIMLKFRVSKELGVKLALTWISVGAGCLFLSCSSRVADQDPLVFLFCYLTLKTPAVILYTVIGMDHMKF